MSLYKQLRIWILLSWSFLTIGILLGSWWAYHELGWGGWWFWDPVENASLMPWLLATASIHSIIRQRLNSWAFFCIQSTFIFSILGTFFVRSGLLSSVHSFAMDSTRGLYLLIFLLFLITIPILNGVYFAPSSMLADLLLRSLEKKIRSRLFKKTLIVVQESKLPLRMSFVKKLFEQLLILQNFYFCTICGVVFCGTASPLIFQWLWNREIITGASFYNSTLIPLFTSIFFIFIYAHFLSLYAFQKTVKAKLRLNWLRKLNFRLSQIFSFYFQLDRFKLTKKEQILTSASASPGENGSLLSLLRRDLSIFYFLIYFIIHILTGILIFELNVLNSIYIAICFLFICCVILSQYKNFTLISYLTMPFSSLPTRLLAKISFSIDQNNQIIEPKYNIFSKYSFLRKVRSKTSLFNSLNRIIKSNWPNMNFFKDANQMLLPNYQSAGYNQNRPWSQDLSFSSRDFSKKEMNIAHTGLVFLILGILFSNTYKFEHTEQLNPGTEGVIRLGSQICYLRSIDHSFAPTFHSICANLLIYPYGTFGGFCFAPTGPSGPYKEMLFHKKNILFSAVKTNVTNSIQKFHFLYKKSQPNHLGDPDVCFAPSEPILCMFPEKRFYYSNQNIVTTKVSIYSNLFTDFYSIIGTGSIDTGWFTTIIKLPFIFCIWLGFILAVIGGIIRLTKLIQKPKLVWF